MSGPHIAALITLVLKQCVARLGSLYFIQKTGVPIGGVFSSVFANIVLGKQEETFDMRWEARQSRYRSARQRPFLRRYQVFAACRYEDDLLVFSEVICEDCLKVIIDHLYSVSFDESGRGSGSIWTDLVIVSHGPCHIGFTPKNGDIFSMTSEWIYGKLPLSPPWIGGFVRDPAILVNIWSCKLSRLNQMNLPMNVYVDAVQTEVLKWILNGYTPNVLLKLIKPIRAQGVKILRRAIASVL